MRLWAVMVMVAVSGWAQSGAPAECAAAPAASGPEWKLLSGSNAPSLWVEGIGKPFPAKAWEVQGSCLHLKAPRGGGSLFTADKFNNFELIFEWKIVPGGNSGLKYMGVDGRRHPDVARLFVKPRLAKIVTYLVPMIVVLLLAWRKKWIFQEFVGRSIGFGAAALLAVLMLFVVFELMSGLRQSDLFPTGLEYQVIDDENNADAKSGGPTHQSGALYDILPPSGVELKKEGFDEGRVLVQGNHAEHWLNGRKVLEYEFGSAELKAAIARSKFAGLPEMAEKSPGRFELQNHEAEVWFRNVRVRPLP